MLDVGVKLVVVAVLDVAAPEMLLEVALPLEVEVRVVALVVLDIAAACGAPA